MSKFEIQFDDLDTPLTRDRLLNPTLANRVERAQIIAAAHIVNGGTEMFDCPKCRGTGQTRWGPCFSCQGKGQRSKRSLAATQAGQTRRQNEADARAAFHRDHADVVAFLADNSGWSDFYRSLNDKLAEYGTLTENQLAAVVRGMAKQAERRAAKQVERTAAAPTVEMSAIEALFATATNNDIKRPIFRADGIEISLAPATGRNAGALYVKAGGDYMGKIVSGKFHAASGTTGQWGTAPADLVERLQAIAADPLAESVKYARRTGQCGCCGRGLVDPVSIRAGIGPICADKWGLDWRREAARESLAEDAS